MSHINNCFAKIEQEFLHNTFKPCYYTVFENTCVKIEKVNLWYSITMVALYQQYQSKAIEQKHIEYTTLKSRLILQGFISEHIEHAREQLQQHNLI